MNGEGIEWAELGQKWVQGRVRRREIGRDTARNQRSALSSFMPFVGARRTITNREIERWLEGRAHLKASTIRSDYAAVRGWCRWLLHEGIIQKDPTYGLRAPKEPRRQPRYLELEQVATIIGAARDAREAAMAWLMFGSGLRCAEVAGIEVGDWDRRGQVVSVTGKGGHQREVPVPEPVKRAIDRYLAEHPATVGPLFRSYRDPSSALTANTISGHMSTLMADAGVKQAPRDGVSAHAFRHSCASDMLEATEGNLWLVAEMLGHVNLQTLRVYLRPARSAEMRKAIVDRQYEPEAEVVRLVPPGRRPGGRATGGDLGAALDDAAA